MANRVTPEVEGGKVDKDTAPKFAETIRTAIDGMRPRRRKFNLVVDLREITYMSSGGIRELLKAQKHAHERGGRIILDMVSPNIDDKLQLTGLGELLPQRPRRQGR